MFYHNNCLPQSCCCNFVAPQSVPRAYLKVARSRKVPARFLPAAARSPQGFAHVAKFAQGWALRKESASWASTHW